MVASHFTLKQTDEKCSVYKLEPIFTKIAKSKSIKLAKKL